MEPLKNTLAVLMSGLSSKKAGFLGAGPEQWLKNTLTKKELQHIKVKYFSKGVLGLNVDSSTWLYSLSLKKEALLQALQKQAPVVKDINLRIGDI
ncbi:MAG: DciA family protein [Candidatus Omnitrophica bacterium]|nr:DciA family protein [Candidatus Omnitrophota bacterium]